MNYSSSSCFIDSGLHITKNEQKKTTYYTKNRFHMHNVNTQHNHVRLRRRNVIVSAIAVLALAAGFTTSAKAESNLTIEESSFDFGYAPQKSKLTHVFWLKSTGTDLLKIAKIVPG